MVSLSRAVSVAPARADLSCLYSQLAASSLSRVRSLSLPTSHVSSSRVVPRASVVRTVKIPENTILSPSEEAAVCGGNVLTSQRITDVVLLAFKACAASQGWCALYRLYFCDLLNRQTSGQYSRRTVAIT